MRVVYIHMRQSVQSGGAVGIMGLEHGLGLHKISQHDQNIVLLDSHSHSSYQYAY